MAGHSLEQIGNPGQPRGGGRWSSAVDRQAALRKSTGCQGRWPRGRGRRRKGGRCAVRTCSSGGAGTGGGVGAQGVCSVHTCTVPTYIYMHGYNTQCALEAWMYVLVNARRRACVCVNMHARACREQLQDLISTWQLLLATGSSV